MARVKLNSLLADLRGRLGSVVFSSNSAGFYCSIYKRPVNPRTEAQSDRRTAFSNLIKSWNLLTPAEQVLWTTYAARSDNERLDWFGDPYYPSSRAQFVTINSYRLQAGLSITTTAPTGNLPSPLPAFDGCVYSAADGSTSYLNPQAAFDASISYVWMSLSLSYSPGRLTRSQPWRFISVYASASSWPYDLDSFLSSAYGIIPASGRYWFHLVPLSSELRPGTPAFYDALIDTEVV